MEKIKKISSVLPWIILIIAIAAISATVHFSSLDKKNHDETVAELQAKIVNLQGTADYLQKKIDVYSNNYDEALSVLDVLYDQIKPTYDADPKALDALAKDLFMKAADKIAKNDYSTFPEFPVYRYYTDQPLEITIDGSKYEMRNREFYWMEDEYSNIFTVEMLNKVLDKRFTEIEGYFYVKEVKKGAKEWSVVNAELTRISEKGDEIKYSVKYDRQEQGKITAKGLTCTMTIKYEDGRYRVSDTNLGNL